MGKFKIAAVQMDSQDNRKNNLRKIEQYVSEAASNGAKMVFLPETSDYIGEDLAGNAAEIPGEITDFFQTLAKNHQIYLHCGSITQRVDGEKARNTSLLYSPSGREIARYSKLHMFDVTIEDGPSYGESDEIQKGGEIVLADTKLCRLGFSICYDLRFPELYRIMGKAGANLMVVAANFTANTGMDHWETLVRARAIENTCYVIAVNQTGSKKSFQAYGNSMIVDPWGKVLARAGEEETLLTAEINLSHEEKVRQQIPSLKNTRDDLYNLNSNCLHLFEE